MFAKRDAAVGPAYRRARDGPKISLVDDMKLYVLPVENACNASCQWCITAFRESAQKPLLATADLEKWLAELPRLEKIEITGGGEPLLHPEIGQVVKTCSLNAPTTLYTNGALLARKAHQLRGVRQIAISRAHYDGKENARIMGIDYDWEAAIGSSTAPVKASLLLHRGGLETAEGVRRYLDWLYKSGIRQAVVRQLLESASRSYSSLFDGARVFVRDIYRTLARKDTTQDTHNPHLDWNGLDVEFEVHSCAGVTHNPVLHADGTVYDGWLDAGNGLVARSNAGMDRHMRVPTTVSGRRATAMFVEGRI